MLRSLLAALCLRASASTRTRQVPRVTSTVIDCRVSPAREAELVEAGRQAVDDFWARSTHVERDGHFDVPRIR